MFSKILIANRGEIAVRVMRACLDLDIRTVAVYSTPDRTAPHVRAAHEAFHIGPAPATESYLNIERILEVARATGSEAIHPGTGFLAENGDFAEACEKAGIVFIGPPPAVLRAMGNKLQAKDIARAAGVPVLPGSGEFSGSIVEAISLVESIGLPVIVKPAEAGGGKGMRLVHEIDQLAPAIERARSESRTSFGCDTVYIEKYLQDPRHIEVQILFDQRGNGIALGERECSIQRRHQKIIEESPSPVVDPATRARLGEWALAAARQAGYVNAGTVEFLRDQSGNFHFIETNARLQVEHPVTEQVFSVDLVKAQILIAAGLPLPFRQEDVAPRGHAIECRITAEDPERSFFPAPGRIEAVRIPSGPGVRDDSAVAPGYKVPLDYDPMVAKLITYGADRTEAIRRMRRALDEYRLVGLTTNIPFLRRLVDHPAFVAGELDTGFIERFGAELISGHDPWLDEVALLAAAVHAYRARVGTALHHEGAAPRAARSRWLDHGRRRLLRGGR